MRGHGEVENKQRSPFFRVVSWPFRHWRWLAVALVCLLAVYAAIDQLLMKRLAAQLDRLREAGRPATFAELGVGNLPPMENAALIYRAAGQNIEAALAATGREELRERFADVTACARRRKDDNRNYAPLSEDELRVIEAHMLAMEPELAKVLEARAMPGCEFGNYASLTGPAANPAAVLPDLAVVRDLARNIAYKAVWEAEQGNTEEALKWVAVNMRLANDLKGDPLLITGLVHAAAASIALNSLERILHGHELPSAVPKELYAELEALRERENLVRFIDGERCFVAAYSGRPQAGRNLLTRVFYYTPGVTALNGVASTLAEALQEEDYAKRRALMAPLEAIDAKQGRFVLPWKAMVQITAPALVRASQAFERHIALADLARIALAIKTFQRDTGKYPEILGQLAPQYLENLPLDTFSGNSYIYKTDESGFLLYSVGPNGMDDAGMPLTGSGGLQGDIVWCGGIEPAP